MIFQFNSHNTFVLINNISGGSCKPIAQRIEVMEKKRREKDRKIVLFIGKTGVGKSTLCNTLVKTDHFQTSSGTDSCTKEVRVKEGFYMGDKTKPITLIDTVGFGDTAEDSDSKETAALIKKLKKDFSHVNLFVIVLNGNDPRIDKSQKDMLDLFAAVFTEKFWEHVLIVFTKVPMTTEMVERRRANQGDDDSWAQKYVTGIGTQVGFGPKYVFIDALQRGADEEARAFEESVDRLYQIMSQNPGLKTDSVRENEERVQEAERKRQAALTERDEANQKRDTVEEERRELAQTLEEKERKIRQIEEEKERKIKQIEDEAKNRETEKEKENLELQDKLRKERDKRHEEEKERVRLREIKNKIEHERDSESNKKEEAEKQRSEEQEKREQLERDIGKANEEKLKLEAKLKEVREEQDWSTRSSTWKRRSNFLDGSIAEEESLSDINPSNDRLAHRVRKASTPIEKGKYENLNIFKPRFQTPSETEGIRLYGEENEKTTKTILVIGAKNRGRKTFVNTLVNHLWDVKISSDQFRFKVAFDEDKATVFAVKNSKLDYNVTIVDIPGFYGDDDPREILKIIVSECHNLKQEKFHSLCFVVRAYDTELTETERHVLSVLPALFTKPPNVNIMATFSDASEPAVRLALTNLGINYDNLFKVNTVFVENGSGNCDSFFEYLNSYNQPLSLGHDDALAQISEIFGEKKEKAWWLPKWLRFKKVQKIASSVSSSRSRPEERSQRHRNSRSVPRQKTKHRPKIRHRSDSR